MQDKNQSKFKEKLEIIIKEIIPITVGIAVFIVIFSFAIYEGGNFLIKFYNNNDIKNSVQGLVFSNNSIDSISDGDANIIRAVENIEKHIESESSLNSSSTKDFSFATSTKSDIQYVILSFDGSRSLKMWEETRQFAKDMTAKGKPLHFSYFINPIYLITKEKALVNYQPPREKMGASLIGYADSEQDVKNRVEQINLAYSEGNEIGSHNVGHFSGLKWNEDEWLQEFNSFDSIISNVQRNNPSVVMPPWSFPLSSVVGFRAPELAVNNDLYKALATKKYLYDSSGMRMPNKYPTKDKNGVWHIGLGIIKMKNLHSVAPSSSVGKTSYVLSMDYNFWMTQSRVKNVAKKGTPLWDNFFNEVKDAYIDHFNKNYEGNHAPVVIGHHFSAWNDGVYWEAMKSFAEDVCGKPKVKCVTFREYVEYLNSVTK